MALEALAPDDLELSIALKRGVIPECPFCGSHAHMHSSVNEKSALTGRTVYQSRITCTNFNCNASVLRNERTREEAQQGVMAQWARRVS